VHHIFDPHSSDDFHLGNDSLMIIWVHAGDDERKISFTSSTILSAAIRYEFHN
jgi:hypothetical protein